MMGSGGGKAVWHVQRTVLFWIIGLMNTVWIRPEDPGTWKNYLGWIVLTLAAADTAYLAYKERQIASATHACARRSQRNVIGRPQSVLRSRALPTHPAALGTTRTRHGDSARLCRMMHLRTLLITLLAFLPGVTQAITPSDLTENLGTTDSSHLSMRFEVTFMKIDVADVDAFLTPDDAAAIKAIPATTTGRDRREQIRDILLAAQSCVMRMTFLRDASWDRILKGIRKNLEAAAKERIITTEEFEMIWSQFQSDFHAMQARGVRKGDALYYRVDPEGVRCIFFGDDGTTLASVERTGDAHIRGTRGAFFGPKSRFSRKLIESLDPE